MQDQILSHENEEKYFHYLQERYINLMQSSEPPSIKAYKKHCDHPEIQKIIAERNRNYNALHHGYSLTYLYKCKKDNELSCEKEKVQFGQQAYIYIEATKQCFFVNHLEEPMTMQNLGSVAFPSLKSTGLLDLEQLQSIHKAIRHSAGIFDQTNANIKLRNTIESKIKIYEAGIDLIDPFVKNIIDLNEVLKSTIGRLEEEKEEKNNVSQALQTLSTLITSEECKRLLVLEKELAKFNNIPKDDKQPLDKLVSYAKSDDINRQNSVFLNDLQRLIKEAMQKVRDTEQCAIKNIMRKMNALNDDVAKMKNNLETKNVIGKPSYSYNEHVLDINKSQFTQFAKKHQDLIENLDQQGTFKSATSALITLEKEKNKVHYNCITQKNNINDVLKKKLFEIYVQIHTVQGLLKVANEHASHLNTSEEKIVNEIKQLYKQAKQNETVLTPQFDTLGKITTILIGKSEDNIDEAITQNNSGLKNAQNLLNKLSPLCVKLEKINSYHSEAKKIIKDLDKQLNNETPPEVLKAICQQLGYISLESEFDQPLSAKEIKQLFFFLKELFLLTNSTKEKDEQTQNIQEKMLILLKNPLCIGRLLTNPLRIKVINELIALHKQQKTGNQKQNSSLEEKAFNELIMLLLNAEDKTIQAVNDIGHDVEDQMTTYEIKLCLIKLILEAKGVSSPVIVNGNEVNLFQKETQIPLDKNGVPTLDNNSAQKTLRLDGKEAKMMFVKKPVFMHVEKKDKNNLSIPIRTTPGVKHLENAITHSVYGKDNIKFIKHFLFDIKGMQPIQPLFHNKEEKTLSQKTNMAFNGLKKAIFGEGDEEMQFSEHATGFENVASQKFSKKQEYFEAFDYTRKYLNNRTDSFFILPENYDAIMFAISEANLNRHSNINKMATVFDNVARNINIYVYTLKNAPAKTRKSDKEIKHLETALKTFRNELIPVLLQNKKLADLETDAKKLARQHFQKNFGSRVFLDILQIITCAWIIIMPIRHFALHKSVFFAGQTEVQKAIDLQGLFKTAKEAAPK